MPDRRSLRLKSYDYSQYGAYFVTIVTEGGVCRLGTVEGTTMILNDIGRMVAAQLQVLEVNFPCVDLDESIVMPSHVHAVLWLSDSPWRESSHLPHALSADPGRSVSERPKLGSVVGAFKSLSSVEYCRGVKQRGWPRVPGRLWQRNYYEHVIRDDRDLQRIREYIAQNPAAWAEDEYNPSKIAREAESVAAGPDKFARRQP